MREPITSSIRSSTGIRQIIARIDSVADRTRLLALDATTGTPGRLRSTMTDSLAATRS